MARPFTDAINRLRWANNFRYSDLEAKSNRVRSTAWFNNLVNYGPSAVNPPPADAVADFAELFGTTQKQVREMIVEEWYSVNVATTSTVSVRVTAMQDVLDGLSEEDHRRVDDVARRLHQLAKTT